MNFLVHCIVFSFLITACMLAMLPALSVGFGIIKVIVCLLLFSDVLTINRMLIEMALGSRCYIYM